MLLHFSQLTISSEDNTSDDYTTTQEITMKLALASLFVTSAAAFAPSKLQSAATTTSTTTLHNDLWGEPPEKEGQSKEMSKALPFAPRPKLLDGTLAADVGFE